MNPVRRSAPPVYSPRDGSSPWFFSARGGSVLSSVVRAFASVPSLAVACLLLLPACRKQEGPVAASPHSSEDDFLRFSNSGRNYFERNEAERAIAAFSDALKLQPSNLDGVLNLANAELLGNHPEEAYRLAESALALDRSQPVAYYLMGCSALRLGRFDAAVKSLQAVKDIDRTINEVSFQLGRAQQGMNHHDAAVAEFEEVVKFAPEHPAAYYALSQSLLRVGQQEEAQKALAQHQKVNANKPAQITDPAAFERCKYTQPRVPFRQTPPDAEGIRVQFVDATAGFFGSSAASLRGPIAVVDYGSARNSLLLRESEQAFRVLANSNGVFSSVGTPFPVKPGARYYTALVADLNNDRAEDVLVLGVGGSHAFKFTTNAMVTEATGFANLRTLSASNGAFADFLFTGNLGLVTVGYGAENVRFLRNLGSMYYSTNATNIGIPPGLSGSHQVVVDDWNGDDMLDLFVQRDGQPPLLLTKLGGGPLVATLSPLDWPSAIAMATGDLNNDLRTDLVLVTATGLTVIFNGQTNRVDIPTGTGAITGVSLVDYDNDGWLDLVATGDRLRVWRNRWTSGFVETTDRLGLAQSGAVSAVQAVDYDDDGDLDFLVTRPDQSIAMFRNEGGNVNRLLKVRLVGNKSNSSGLGVRVEVSTGGLRLMRRAQVLPMEIGVGSYTNLDSLNARWFTMNVNTVDVKVDPKTPVRLDELTINETSCPYLYAWDGKQFRFVSDILGAAPVGLPLAPGRYIEADADEFVWLGDESRFQPRAGQYLLSVTEELKEVLYLDEARLFVVDHPAGTVVHSTDKLLPGAPFPTSELRTLELRHPLLHATRLDGTDITEVLQSVDGRKASPLRLREYPLRGLAEPHGVILDFGALPVERPLILALNGWLKFGGGTANVAASMTPDLPFPFPVLEVEIAADTWRTVDVQAGAPAGKTKTILIELSGKLPAGSRRLRLTTAFEIHWDQIALWERRLTEDTKISSFAPSSTDLHWRGFGEIAALPWTEPQTPIYERVQANPPWRTSPAGWATRYGPVDELLAARDNMLVLVNSGDELLLRFNAASLPPKPAGMERDFFLYSVGWDKDGDVHVARRETFEPLPWHGMNDQLHGIESRPAFTNDAWMEKYNTRWSGPEVLTRLR